ncbi:hypothetical protein PLICRDRAFT_40829 [Plicaturopsis crispa FD-325 SS-3]|nr:hypothetical protein PLICRDRAFT_40829 [Plicaturopsis crispa FD-325 SS-3]
MENESTFVAPEGVYSVTEEHKPLALHAHVANAAPPLYPTRLSTIAIRFPAAKHTSAPGFGQLRLGGNKDVKKDKWAANKEREDGLSASGSSEPIDETYSPDLSNPPLAENTSTSPLISEQHTLFSAPNGASKRKATSRPKHNIRTTSSTFITRLQTTEGLAKTLQSKNGEATFIFYNAAKSFVWAEMGSKSKEPLTRITFSAYPTCHGVNTSTASPEHIDIVIGFNTGDLVWFDPTCLRYTRLNKQGSISNSPCTAVRWVPSSSTLFLVSHADGTIIIYDKEREDGVFIPQSPSISQAPQTNGSPPTSHASSSPEKWDPSDSIFVTMPPWHPASGFGGKSDKEKTAKNPVSHWRVSQRGVVDFVFSPDVKYVAAISEDGCLRVIDALAEQLVDCYASYFGSLTCVAWSPDGRFILTGGQDDLLTIISPWEQRVIARCQGHSSFVSSVAFDDVRCDTRTYRFGSVGEDNKLILWDFSSGALHRPKFQAAHHQRMSMASTVSLGFRRGGSILHLPSTASPGADGPGPRFHPAPSRNEVSVVQPVLIKHVESELLTAVSFIPRALLTATKAGHIKVWIRPLAIRARHMKTRDRSYSVDIQDLIN